jgi:hypothetical protein
MNSYRVKVIADSSGEFVGNGLTFASIEEAKKYGRDLAWRWTAVREWKVFEITENGDLAIEE